MTTDSDWEVDKRRYPRRPFLKEQSIWAVWVYRFGKRVDKRRGLERVLYTKVYLVFYRVIETLTGIGLPKECDIGPGLRIHHFGGIFVHPKAVLGAQCTLRQGVTIGNKEEGGPAPVIGDNVEIGAYAQIIGGITIGDNVRIGASAVVVKDCPSGVALAGNPAALIGKAK